MTGHFGRPLLDFIFFFRSASRARPGSFRLFFLFESLSEDIHGGCTERLQVVVSGEQSLVGVSLAVVRDLSVKRVLEGVAANVDCSLTGSILREVVDVQAVGKGGCEEEFVAVEKSLVCDVDLDLAADVVGVLGHHMFQQAGFKAGGG